MRRESGGKKEWEWRGRKGKGIERRDEQRTDFIRALRRNTFSVMGASHFVRLDVLFGPDLIHISAPAK